MTYDEPDQEVWITLRLKGSMPLCVDTHAVVGALVKRIEAYLLHSPTNLKPALWHRFFKPHVRDLDFTLTQPPELIEVEEEAEIYDTEQHVL